MGVRPDVRPHDRHRASRRFGVVVADRRHAASHFAKADRHGARGVNARSASLRPKAIMLGRLSIACFCLLLATAGCTSGPDAPRQAGGGETATRPLASMLPFIKKSLTPLLAEQTFGAA